MHHILKTDPAVFRAVRDGVKNFEVRKDDRAFQAGDTVELRYHERSDMPGAFLPPRAIDPADKLDPIQARIGFVLRGGQYGLEAGYVAFSLLPHPVVTA